MEIEDIAGISFAARRTLEDQRYLAVSNGLFRQVIVYDKGVAAGITEILADSNACKGAK